MHETSFFGDFVRRRTAGPFSITESLVESGAVLPTHSHRSAYFTLTLNGSYREHYDGRTRECTPGTAVAHPAHEFHSETFGREPALLVRLECGDPADGPLPFVVERATAVTSAHVVRAAWQLHGEMMASDAYADLILEGLARELAGYALRASIASGGSRARALRAESLLRASLRSNASAHALAKQLGVSVATFFRDFRSAFGCTPGEYQRRVRIYAAMESLRNSTRPLADIAAECGFYDQSHLNRSFRRAVGYSPAEFRRTAR